MTSLDGVQFGPYSGGGGWGGSVRYNGANGLRRSDVLAAHGLDVISGIYVTTGFSGGSDLTALLRGLSVNGHQFTFGSA